MEELELKWLFLNGVPGAAFRPWGEVKATLRDLRYRTLTLKML
jgi:hypothetical protein